MIDIAQFIADYITDKSAQQIANELFNAAGTGDPAGGFIAAYNAAVHGKDVKDDITRIALLQNAYWEEVRTATLALTALASATTVTGDDVAFDGDVKVGGTKPVFRYMRTLTNDDSLDSEDLTIPGIYLRLADITEGSTLYNSEPTHTGYMLLVFANPGTTGTKRVTHVIFNNNGTLLCRAKLFAQTWSDWSSAAKKAYVDELFTKYNCNFIADHASVNQTEKTRNGITYNVVNGVVTLSGTATEKTFVILAGSTDAIPAWVTDGKYYVNIKKSVPDAVIYQISCYQSGQYVKSFCYKTESDWFEIDGSDEMDGVVCRLVIPQGATVDNTIEVEILTAIPNENIVAEASGAPVKIRLMQYNIGKFNRGQPLTGDYHFLTTDNFTTVLNRYKSLFCEMQPDIIGMQEAEDEVTVKGVGGESDYDVSMNNMLFDKLYPWSDMQAESVISKRSVKSKYPFVTSTRQNVPYSYEWESETITSNFWVIYSHIRIGSKTIAVVSNAFPNSNDEWTSERNLVWKKACFQAVADLLENDEYAFIICDANAGQENMLHIMYDTGGMAGRGYDFVNGSYFPWAETYESEKIPGKRSYVDQILYKDNGKILLSSFITRWADRENLASDHIPIFADFLIL